MRSMAATPDRRGTLVRRFAVPIACCLLWSAAPAQAADTGDCMVMLANGDQIRGTIQQVDAGSLVLRPTIAPDAVIRVSLERINTLVFGAPRGSAASSAPDVLRLRDGTELRGVLTALTDTGLTFDAEHIGPLTFKADSVDQVLRGKTKPANAAGRPDCHVLATTGGNIMVGAVKPEGEGLISIAGPAVSAQIPLSAIASLTFPEPKPAATQPAPKKEVTASVLLATGVMLTGTAPGLKAGRIAVTLAGGQRVSVPTERVAEVSFSVTGGSLVRRSILVWGGHSDRNDEHRKTMELVKAEFARGWQIAENFDRTITPEFRRALSRAGVLLITEMEGWGGGDGRDLGRALKPVADAFLRRGGNVILLGPTSTQVTFMREAGLMDVSATTNSSGGSHPFTTAGRQIGKGVGKAFTATNSTQFYRSGTTLRSEAWADTDASAPILGRRVGRGYVILMGMDYYEHNETTKKLLVNAITYR